MGPREPTPIHSDRLGPLPIRPWTNGGSAAADPVAAPAARERLAGAERIAVLALIAIGLVVRALAVLHHAVNTDEPQHLHVAWAWTQGLLPYRDVFDNHTPLFNLLLSPVLALAGERADIVPVMRLAVVPFALVALAATWVIARRLFSARVAPWAVALVAVNPEFLRASVEYRTDQLWMAAWLVALAVLVSGPLTLRRSFLAGLVLGAALATSMKTTLLLACLLAAALVTLALLATRGVRPATRGLLARAASALAGFVLLPAALAAFFAAQGAWRPLLYGVVWHNLVPGLGLWNAAPLRPLLLVAAAPLLVGLAAVLVRRSPDPALGARRALLLVATGLAHAAIEGVWPLVTRADLLPLLPVEAVFAGALLVALPGAVARRGPRAAAWGRALVWLPALLVAAETCAAATVEPVWRDHTRHQIGVLGQVLRLTRPGDPVMDVKGEAIFRPRPFYYAIETITEERFRLGLLRDDIPERLRATRTAAVVESPGDPFPLPPRARAFVEANYLPVGAVRVLGVMLPAAASDGPEPRAFALQIPQRYALASATGPARGWLDGTPYAGPRVLARGRHTYRPQDDEGTVALLWADAVERGASPFGPPRQGP